MGGNPPDFHLLAMTGTRELRNEWKGWATTFIGRSARWKLQLFVMLSLRSRRSPAAENLFLRRQPALMQERGIKPRRIDPATRVSCSQREGEHGSRRLVHFNITQHPTAAWTLQQLREVIGSLDGYRYLLHDRDSIFAQHLDASISRLGLRVLKSAA